jgi:uncharacterized membrane protein
MQANTSPIHVTVKVMAFSGIDSAVFNQIRQHEGSSAAVLIRRLQVFGGVIEQTEDAEQKKALLKQAEMIHRSALENIPEKFDLVTSRIAL